jgi:GR25 family glycosyltransferase involved in LPS biosynthesis
MDNPWSFFKEIWIISLKIDDAKRARISSMLSVYPGISYKILDAVYGKKNPYLRESYTQRGILKQGVHLTDGQLGCLASHRAIWESALLGAEGSTPFWTLILEDDAVLHPSLTNELLGQYLQALPGDARYFKLGYLATSPFLSKFSISNKYWMKFNDCVSFSTICYAVRSDLLPALLAHTFSTPLDHIGIPYAYGAIDPESVLDVPLDRTFHLYKNPYLHAEELFHGVASVIDGESRTAPTATTVASE